MAKRVIFGWTDHDKAFLSPFHASQYERPGTRPANWYDSRAEAEAEAAKRRCDVEWEADASA